MKTSLNASIPPSPSENTLLNVLKEILQEIINAIGGIARHLFHAVWPQVLNAWNDAKNFATEHPWCAAALVALVLGVIFAHPLLQLFAAELGFTSSGVKAGSIAAGIQAKFYGGFVPAGSIFASLQSFGAL